MKQAATKDPDQALMHRVAYVAFDRFPSSKGAATHIAKMSRFLFDRYQGGILITLGDPDQLQCEKEETIEIRRFTKSVPNFLERTEAFALFVEDILLEFPYLTLIHFRDIWSGIGILNARARESNNFNQKCRLLFEVNGLPSIELPYHYSSIREKTLNKIKELEDRCMAESDQLLVPSKVIAAYLESRQNEENKKPITVVPNAGNGSPNFAKVDPIKGPYIMYFGAMQSWQGVGDLLRAFALLKDYSDHSLLICSSGKEKTAKRYKKLSSRLGTEDRVIWKHRISKADLNAYIREALLTVAPLKECSRNVLQGCSPLKIFESMACETVVVASRLAVTEEIIEDRSTGLLVNADRPSDLSRAIRLLIEYPEKRKEWARKGKALLEKKFTWRIVEEKMNELYSKIEALDSEQG